MLLVNTAGHCFGAAFPGEDERSINQAVRPNGGGQSKNQNCPSLPSHRTGGDASPVPSTGVTPKAPQDTVTSGWRLASLCLGSLEVLKFFRKVSWGSLEVLNVLHIWG